MDGVEESKGTRGDAEHGRTSSKINGRRTSWGCVFLLVNNLFQYTAYFGVSTDLVNYLKVELHDGSKAAANSVTNWQGAGSITPLVAAFLADSFLGRFWTITLFLLISVAGYGVVTASAWAASSSTSSTAPFYAGLYLVALGGALQPVMSSFGADQFDASASPSERARQSSFFNWFYLSVTAGSLVGGTLLVWVQASHGWRLGYGIPALLSALAVALFLAGAPAYRRHQPPGGSPLTRVAQVVVAAARNWDAQVPQDDAAGKLYECDGEDGMSVIQGSRRLAHTDQFRFLDKAAVKSSSSSSSSPSSDNKAAAPSPWRLCTVTQVEELKCVLRLLPVWACGIIFAAAYTQMTTTFILQGDTLDPYLFGRRRGFRVPAAMLSVFDTLSVMLWVPLYDRVLVPVARRLTRSNTTGFSPLARMGVGYVILTLAMLCAGALEVARRRAISRHGAPGAGEGSYLPLSIFWQVPQYAVVGAAEVFTFIGQMEFFYDQAPDAMRSLCSGLSNAAFAMGNYASSALVAVVVRATARGGNPGWIPDDINVGGHLDYFFWLMAMLCAGNFGAYLLVARSYTYKKTVDCKFSDEPGRD